ncbi:MULTISPECIES: TM2 domain-containing protein [Acidobacterium]|nr:MULTISPECIES: TM2 domain-containing protein [Acidobacterium]
MTPANYYPADASPAQQALFYQHMAMVQKDELLGALLALFLGTFGAHRFYLGETTAGILYILFCWTGIPTLLGIIECFFMPSRVRTWNLNHAMQISAWVRGQMPSPAVYKY